MELPKTCRKCHESGPFHPSYLARCNYLCKACASAAVKECRTRNPARLLAYRAHNVLRCPTITVEFVQEVLERCQFRSVISGEQDVNLLCLVPFFKDIPPEPWHCLIVTRYEAKAMTRSKNIVPEEIQQDLYKRKH